jgi:hypothetical protein
MGYGEVDPLLAKMNYGTSECFRYWYPMVMCSGSAFCNRSRTSGPDDILTGMHATHWPAKYV